MQIDENTQFVTPPHMLIYLREGKKIIIPLKRLKSGEWRDALNGTRSGSITCSDRIEKAYQATLNNLIVG